MSKYCSVYKLTGKIRDVIYVGNIQNAPKFYQHFQHLYQKVQYDQSSDSLAAHFANFLNPKPNSTKMLHN